MQSARVRSVINMDPIEQQPPLELLQQDVSKISVVAEKAKKRPRAPRKSKAVETTTTATQTNTDNPPKKRPKKEKKKAIPTDEGVIVAVAASTSANTDCAGLLMEDAIIEDGFVKTNTRIKAKRHTMVLLSCPQLRVEDHALPIYSEDFSVILTVDITGKNCIIVLHMHSDVVIESNVSIFKVINQ